ncbi:tRNA delta(2)-isopentenylpyrophosphate transferase [Ligilactobacillus salitolerans]|uniref:tRNA dimethylallyltransferase n=1 Tax=Ligilactobacillus salitolerans TaxID=1808352 RepID=A0A401IRF1_9LACO|nr:tRNA (adenosine(37)-N6)-dimethylallyltransferase MiaA [Ligilactobacillus salitolerans]GBG94113.1 tRNA delta(2)-isopentenylpyrophosphate transferase [Ligilactobacillus salitolerans]
MTQKVLLIVGPTAVGKTTLSIELAQLFNGEIISGDSMQVYTGLDIGTAKIEPEEMAGIPHYLLDILSVDQRFSVADFVTLSKEKCQEISRRQKLPLIVGGTGFYLQALLDGYNLGSTYNSAGQKIRDELQQFAAQQGKQALWDRLEKIDPAAAVKIPVNNTRRVIRALEVYEQTGQLFSEQKDTPTLEIKPLIIGLNTDRQLLYSRIDQRVDQMLAKGLLAEAEKLYSEGGLELPAGKGIGYKELFPYFAQKASLAECASLIKKNSRHYAKRQLTWFHNKMDVEWYDLVQHPKEIDQIITRVGEWLAN